MNLFLPLLLIAVIVIAITLSVYSVIGYFFINHHIFAKKSAECKYILKNIFTYYTKTTKKENYPKIVSIYAPNMEYPIIDTNNVNEVIKVALTVVFSLIYYLLPFYILIFVSLFLNNYYVNT